MDEFLWCEKYRPKTIDETILPEEMKAKFKGFLRKKSLPNFIFAGATGTGKTTVALALCNQLNIDTYFVNASLKGNMELLRTKLQEFASTVSLMKDGRKIVIMDEADAITAQAQHALRGFIEEFSDNCGFIFTCNHLNKIIPELVGRCAVVEFTIPKEERALLGREIYLRVTDILEKEGVKYDKKVVMGAVKNFFPNYRGLINALQYHSVNGELDSTLLSFDHDKTFTELWQDMSKKEFKRVREWCGRNSELDFFEVVKRIYNGADDHIVPNSLPALVLILAHYQMQYHMAINKEVHMVAMVCEIMRDVEFLGE